MKIAHLLGQYLLQNKKMQLQGIGEFVLDNFYENPFENEKGKIRLPGNTIQFSPDKKTPEDGGLIDFIAQHTGKIRPLASSDLEDFLNIGKQLLNVSKQFYIEGLGTLILNDSNDYDFIQGNEVIVATVPEEYNSKKRAAKREERSDDMSFGNGYPQPGKTSENTLRKLLVLFAMVLGLAIIGWIVYYFFQQWQAGKTRQGNTLENIQPVLPSPPAAQDFAATGADSTVISLPANNGNTSYKVIIETSRRMRALSRHEELLKMGYDVKLSTEDSVSFKLYTLITGPLSDTGRSRDSITRFFGRKARIELK
ncbi:hypothetical protein [Agriterribacter sp.]|uniref:hypothetical protein n=1 Tax=Agriterribacter sp. TaxID=2821509 RepID=UPI002B907C69|nr:hypothetical protein [Agriterribacter sp.]HRO44309.1 hypothetical protein [Agriterribacter sp.]HRQ19291.1 hypothetical protein [Agriterribacter sp.]